MYQKLNLQLQMNINLFVSCVTATKKCLCKTCTRFLPGLVWQLAASYPCTAVTKKADAMYGKA